MTGEWVWVGRGLSICVCFVASSSDYEVRSHSVHNTIRTSMNGMERTDRGGEQIFTGRAWKKERLRVGSVLCVR